MFVLVIFAGQLLIAEPAAASGTQCLKCITDCSESQQREEDLGGVREAEAVFSNQPGFSNQTGGGGSFLNLVKQDNPTTLIPVFIEPCNQAASASDLLSRMHSPHLVGLLGYCADQSHRLLVFELMPNGTLKSHLHRPAAVATDNQEARSPALDWQTRLCIALDCARALEFLHEFVACTSSSIVGGSLVELSLHRASSSLARLWAAVWRSRPCTAAPPGCCGDLFS
ncbi:hypothetical protein QYE76_055658 [Lolium multiflorum]|uniref:Serine-threonine/tyrosine-protein kinase catalytic domain-containing protein n=1 Tax=Lolium multiflorum TaxID=4521 RepID=A0AAD8T165_LOLMU|nr:hypothetical protein QYE76_055658 [Lolium multiflorum]